jgi:hypothetical protein
LRPPCVRLVRGLVKFPSERLEWIGAPARPTTGRAHECQQTIRTVMSVCEPGNCGLEPRRPRGERCLTVLTYQRAPRGRPVLTVHRFGGRLHRHGRAEFSAAHHRPHRLRVRHQPRVGASPRTIPAKMRWSTRPGSRLLALRPWSPLCAGGDHSALDLSRGGTSRDTGKRGLVSGPRACQGGGRAVGVPSSLATRRWRVLRLPH